MAFSNILSLGQQVGSIVSLYSAADQAEEAGALQAGAFRSAGTAAVQGGQYSAGVYRNAGIAAVQMAGYNVELNKIEQSRKEAAMSLQLSDVMSSNRAAQGASGFSFSSGSYLATVRDGLARMEQASVQMRNTYAQQRQQITYEGQLTNMNYENQARNAEYQGEVARVNYENQARMAEYQAEVSASRYRSSAFGNIGSFVSNLTSLI